MNANTVCGISRGHTPLEPVGVDANGGIVMRCPCARVFTT